jgi:hypothetical protein
MSPVPVALKSSVDEGCVMIGKIIRFTRLTLSPKEKGSRAEYSERSEHGYKVRCRKWYCSGRAGYTSLPGDSA